MIRMLSEGESDLEIITCYDGLEGVALWKEKCPEFTIIDEEIKGIVSGAQVRDILLRLNSQAQIVLQRYDDLKMEVSGWKQKN